MSVHFSSNSNEWNTPDDLYNILDKEFNFTLDPCTNGLNNKCEFYYTEKENGLIQDWSKDIVFMNPPYGRQISQWIEKAYNESLKGSKVVCLIPSRTDTKYWHDFIFNKASEIRFIKGRLKFGNSKNSAPFPSAIIVYNSKFNKTKYPNHIRGDLLISEISMLIVTILMFISVLKS